jgi:hypothetical protein
MLHLQARLALTETPSGPVVTPPGAGMLGAAFSTTLEGHFPTIPDNYGGFVEDVEPGLIDGGQDAEQVMSPKQKATLPAPR